MKDINLRDMMDEERANWQRADVGPGGAQLSWRVFVGESTDMTNTIYVIDEVNEVLVGKCEFSEAALSDDVPAIARFVAEALLSDLAYDARAEPIGIIYHDGADGTYTLDTLKAVGNDPHHVADLTRTVAHNLARVTCHYCCSTDVVTPMLRDDLVDVTTQSDLASELNDEAD